MKIFNHIFKGQTPSVKETITTGKAESNTGIVTEENQTSPLTSETQEMDEIKVLFDKHDVPLTKETRAMVETFLSQGEGSLESKLETLDLALTKGVELSLGRLTQIHMALNTSVDYGKIFESIMPKVDLDPNTDSSSQETDVITKEAYVKAAVQEKLLQVFTMASSEPSQEAPKAHVIKDMPVEETIQEDHVEDTSYKSDLDDEMAVWDDLKDIFSELGDNIDEIMSELMPIMTQDFFDQPLPSLKLIEITVTEKMTQAKETFDVIQKQLVNQLENIKPQMVDAKAILTAAIDKLDKILNQSDVPLFSSMTMERDLIQSSTLLDRAKTMIDTKPDKAFELVEKVKTTIERIDFKPSQKKMYVQTKQQFFQNLYEEKQIQIMPYDTSEMATSPRKMLDTLRYIGLNHEAEVAEMIDKDQKSAFKAPINIKSILMQLEEQSQRVEAKSTLDFMTGHQLLNKLEVQSGKQQMVFKIPVEINGVSKNLRVQVNAKKQNEKLDWQNSRLYFVIHLDKLGDTGVLVDVNQGKVNITIKNDTESFEQIVKPFANQALERLQDVGFEEAKLTFAPLSQKEEIIESEPVNKEEEGFDVVI